jgi:hypothetical protein
MTRRDAEEAKIFGDNFQERYRNLNRFTSPLHPLFTRGEGPDRWARSIKIALMSPDAVLNLTPKSPLHTRRGDFAAVFSPSPLHGEGAGG